MPTYFADTWFYIALLDRRDSHSSRARRVAAAIRGADVVTHEHIFAETLAYFADAGANLREHAVAMVRDALRTSQVITPDRALFVRALDRYAARPDKEYSLVDCMSMVIMEGRGIHHVLTNDHHFTQAGFTIVNQ